MNYFIQEVITKTDLKNFLDLPWKIYSKDPLWVPPLKLALNDLFSKKHPFYETSEMKSWLLWENKEIKGRISAIINHDYNKFHNENCGFFGFFETADNSPEITKALFDTVENYFLEKNIKTIHGPVNPSTNYECGLLVKGTQDPPQIMMTYNPMEYQSLFEKAGYTKEKDLIAFNLPIDRPLPETIAKIAERIEKSENITYRVLNKADWDNEVDRMHEIYNDAWEKNWGFVPMTKKEFYHTAKDLKSVVEEDLIIFAEVNKEVAGFIIGLPDFNQIFKTIPSGKLLPTGIFKLLFGKKKINRCRVLTLGLKQKFRNRGLEAILIKKIQEMAIKKGLKEAELSWILEDNIKMIKPIERLGGEPYKTYRIYKKELQ